MERHFPIKLGQIMLSIAINVAVHCPYQIGVHKAVFKHTCRVFEQRIALPYNHILQAKEN